MRQRIRKLLLIISLLLFPLTIWYFSPALIFMAFSQHILNGSFILFMSLFVFSLFFGRVFCGYICPAGALQECACEVNSKPAKGGKRNIIKYVIWVIWLAMLGYVFFTGSGDITVDFFFKTTHGISVAEIMDYITYYGVLTILIVPAIIHGRRASCHYLCWMAPFMTIGSAIGRKLHIPQLHVEADLSKCTSCNRCTSNCPMSLDVAKLIHESGYAASTECINCGKCVDNCKNKALSYKFTWH